MEELTSLFDDRPVTIAKFEGVVSTQPEGTFVRSEPKDDEIVDHGTAFALYVAAPGVQVPDLVSLKPLKAIDILKGVGLDHEIRYELNLDGKDGKIFKTEPPATEALIAGAKVMLVISARGGWVYIRGHGQEPGNSVTNSSLGSSPVPWGTP